MAARHLFSVFDVTRQVFFETPLSLGIVNLKPLRPGHVLIISKRVVPRLVDLDHAEVSDLFQCVQRVGHMVEKAYEAEALNIAVQDGASAGQSVPHVHVHIIPRLRSDFGGEPDNVYPALEGAERDLNADLVRHRSVSDSAGTGAGAVEAAVEAAKRRRANGWQVPKDEERRPRNIEEMEAEARWLAGLLSRS
ncbi:HIT-like protein [Cutaneotrichosporon oleaginosum]|uniref:Bis(5'-adenosyl)-triphosphatase n=1 Tax=Cutaneotrichosporon oleaginosum TaxID=879819 RepID=A0A0J0XYE4_9TREE|nr:HIT-like protein [Cutaneotrichosporon oleaginosum]KLT46063.1 HIT-like protein [Cutaneotrichosporon oleaginosum]TXT06756.1 hypothetical protein COLE_06087 [Cutaneotrichosporon oleaginosum]